MTLDPSLFTLFLLIYHPYIPLHFALVYISFSTTPLVQSLYSQSLTSIYVSALRICKLKCLYSINTICTWILCLCLLVTNCVGVSKVLPVQHPCYIFPVVGSYSTVVSTIIICSLADQLKDLVSRQSDCLPLGWLARVAR